VTVTATLRIPAPLRRLTSGADELVVRGQTVREALDDAGREHAGLIDGVLGADGQLRSFVNVFVGERNVRALQGLQTPLREGDVIAILPAVAGGRPRGPCGPRRPCRPCRPYGPCGPCGPRRARRAEDAS
jgi:molybdopterin synthase sulfur carrier subunit